MKKGNDLKDKLANMPSLPGIYLMKDGQGEILYCGKAISLKKRVASYFKGTPRQDPRRAFMISQIRDFEYIVTNSEFEALILESNLIKRYRPRFNVLLRDDKQYPHLCLTMNEAFPRLKVVRRVKRDNKCLYFGPYTPAKAMRETLRLINRIFPIRKCSHTLGRVNKSPCLNYQMGLCCGPCAGFITKEEYAALINEVILFLQGKKDDLVKSLQRQMADAADHQRFEDAARLRDQIRSIRACMQRQYVFLSSTADQDYFVFARDGERAFIQVFFIRFGMLTGRKILHINGAKETPDEDLMGEILKQFYGDDKGIPPKVLVQIMPSEAPLIERWLSEKRGTKVRIIKPRRGDKKELMSMAQKNVTLDVLLTPFKGSEEYIDILKQVQQDLNLQRLPRRIEGFDISNLGSEEAVGAMVLWEDAVAVKSKYRKFKIKDIHGIDDYGMMNEVIRRRYTRLLNEGDSLPDLILIDGGKGHLMAAIGALEDLNLEGVAVASLAKREEVIFLPQRESPLALPERSPTLQLLQRIRDEAHRFAITYQKSRRKKRAFLSALDTIPGVGRRRKEELLRFFHGIQGIKRASVEDLLKVPKMDRKTAQRVFEEFH